MLFFFWLFSIKIKKISIQRDPKKEFGKSEERNVRERSLGPVGGGLGSLERWGCSNYQHGEIKHKIKTKQKFLLKKKEIENKYKSLRYSLDPYIRILFLNFRRHVCFDLRTFTGWGVRGVQGKETDKCQPTQRKVWKRSTLP